MGWSKSKILLWMDEDENKIKSQVLAIFRLVNIFFLKESCVFGGGIVFYLTQDSQCHGISDLLLGDWEISKSYPVNLHI